MLFQGKRSVPCCCHIVVQDIMECKCKQDILFFLRMGRTGIDLGKTAPFFNDVSTKGMFSQGSVLLC